MGKYGKRLTKISIDTPVVRLLSDCLLEQTRRTMISMPDRLHDGVFDHDFDAHWVSNVVSTILSEVCLRFLDSGHGCVADVLRLERYELIYSTESSNELEEVLRQAIRVAQHPSGIEHALRTANKKAIKRDLHVIPNDEFLSLPGEDCND